MSRLPQWGELTDRQRALVVLAVVTDSVAKVVALRDLRRAVELRDGHCVFAGCTAPAAWCQAHHVLEWLFGGRTELENLALLCERHHGKVHHGYRIERDTDGTWHTHRPDGTEIVVPGAAAVPGESLAPGVAAVIREVLVPAGSGPPVFAAV